MFCREKTVPSLGPAGSFTGRGETGDGEHPCPAGHYCPAGLSAPLACANGTFSPSVGAVNASTCRNCTKGHWCGAAGLGAPSGACAAGYYCGRGVATATPAATVCPAGSFCANGSVVPTACEPGSYAPTVGLGACLGCPAGSYCLRGASAPAPCPRGYFCPNATASATANPCPPGTFADATGARSVDDCLEMSCNLLFNLQFLNLKFAIHSSVPAAFPLSGAVCGDAGARSRRSAPRGAARWSPLTSGGADWKGSGGSPLSCSR